ncbi:MAG: hypothetical protein ACI905_000189 [Roseivirga sp.]|jgi:hypothetical protein
MRLNFFKMLYEIVYHSQAKTSITEVDIQTILQQSRKNNVKKGITGCLLYHKTQFLQLLEGEESQINQLYEIIKNDPRHKNVIILHAEKITDRIFDKWSMAFKDLGEKDFLENTIGVMALNDVLRKDDSGNISKEIFKTISNAILNSH